MNESKNDKSKKVRPGDIDLSFDNDGRMTFPGDGIGLPTSDEKIWVFGEKRTEQAVTVARFMSDGSEDKDFTPGSVTPPYRGGNNLYKAAEQPNGRIILYGTLHPESNPSFPYAMCIDAQGRLDTSFGMMGMKQIQFDPGRPNSGKRYEDSVIQPDGKLVVLASGMLETNVAYRVIRLNETNGSEDAGFGTTGVVYDLPEDVVFEKIAILKNNRLLLSGHSIRGIQEYTVLTRLMADGKLDPDFGDNGTVRLDYVFQDLTGSAEFGGIAFFNMDDSMVVGGRFTIRSESIGGWIMKLTPSGIPDRGFNEGKPLFVDVPVSALGTQDDKAILQGYRNSSGVSSMYLGRVNSEGALDETFGEDGIVRAPSYVLATNDLWKRHYVVVRGQDKKTLFVSSVVDDGLEVLTQLVRFLLTEELQP